MLPKSNSRERGMKGRQQERVLHANKLTNSHSENRLHMMRYRWIPSNWYHCACIIINFHQFAFIRRLKHYLIFVVKTNFFCCRLFVAALGWILSDATAQISIVKQLYSTFYFPISFFQLTEDKKNFGKIEFRIRMGTLGTHSQIHLIISLRVKENHLFICSVAAGWGCSMHHYTQSSHFRYTLLRNKKNKKKTKNLFLLINFCVFVVSFPQTQTVSLVITFRWNC